MPKIEVLKADLFRLLNKEYSAEELTGHLECAKAELDETGAGHFKIELNDTNRPDLWTTAGIARQLNQYLHERRYEYEFGKNDGSNRITVDPALEKIRPWIVGFGVRNLKVDEPLLLELIQNQEKFSLNFGKKRHDISIGIYKWKNIRFPVHYKAVEPEKMRFSPLGEERELNLREILEIHPKGIEYGYILRNFQRYPILVDDRGGVLSFPPIINSRAIGAVEIGDSELLVELTGFTLTNMVLVANIMACDLIDRGAEIRPCLIEYPYDTPYGREFSVPFSFKSQQDVDLEELRRMAGTRLTEKEIRLCLEKMGYTSFQFGKKQLQVEVPPYRNDIMHSVDVIEDVIIGRGFNNFTVKLPAEFTTGSVTALENFSDQVRSLVVGMGFQEIISNILTSRENLCQKMTMPENSAVEILNPMTESYNVLRNSIIPSLLEVETTSAKADYPHLIFEAGEVAQSDPESSDGVSTRLNLGILCAHPKANFSEIRSYLDNILFYAGTDQFELQALEIPYLLSGRCAEIRSQGRVLGYFGELHPAVLEHWGINMPCAVLELCLERLQPKS